MADIARRVLIVGGGIGGLTAAVALAQAGIAVELVEIKSEWTVYGVGIIQPNNALRALGRIGLAAPCLAAGSAFSGWRLCDASGNLLVEVANSNATAPQYPPNNGISRPNLHKILCTGARQHDVRVRLGTTVARIDLHDDAVDVEFSDGSRGSYDLLIGADGVHSRVRSLLFGTTAALEPRFTGQSVWRHNFARPPEITWGMLYYGKNTKAGLVPMSADSMYLLLVTAEPGNPRLPQDELHVLMRERLQEYGGIVATLAEQITDPGCVVYKPMESLLVPSPWYRGRAVLIGDAAHATTPHLAQGASIAVEDAVVLAELLAGHSVHAALDAFMPRRFERCRLIVDTSFQLGRLEQLEWQGRTDPSADPAALMERAWKRMAEPF